MGLAIDSIGLVQTGVWATGNPTVAAAGDSLTIRNFTAPAYATLEAIMYQATTAGFIQVKSPLFHDDVRGIQFTPGQSPATLLMPRVTGQNLISQDTLSVEINPGLAAEVDVSVLSVYYSNLSGAAARLAMWADIKGNVKSIKPLEIDVGAGTAGVWNDTVITTTENLLHANTDYAVLGYVTNKPLTAIGIRGTDTSNLRVTGPGTIDETITTEWFVSMSERHGTPHIPIFNAANMFNTYCSVIQGTTAAAAVVSLVLAEMRAPVPV